MTKTKTANIATATKTQKRQRQRQKRAQFAQPRIPGLRRVPTWGGLHPDVRRAVERDAARFGVSRSWVLSVAVATAMGIELSHKERYDR